MFLTPDDYCSRQLITCKRAAFSLPAVFTSLRHSSKKKHLKFTNHFFNVSHVDVLCRFWQVFLKNFLFSTSTVWQSSQELDWCCREKLFVTETLRKIRSDFSKDMCPLQACPHEKFSWSVWWVVQIVCHSPEAVCVCVCAGIELDRLDADLIKLLAYQRIQQLFPTKAPSTPPLPAPSTASKSLPPHSDSKSVMWPLPVFVLPVNGSVCDLMMLSAGQKKVQVRAVFYPLTGRGGAVSMCYRTLYIGSGERQTSARPFTLKHVHSNPINPK